MKCDICDVFVANMAAWSDHIDSEHCERSVKKEMCAEVDVKEEKDGISMEHVEVKAEHSDGSDLRFGDLEKDVKEEFDVDSKFVDEQYMGGHCFSGDKNEDSEIIMEGHNHQDGEIKNEVDSHVVRIK